MKLRGRMSLRQAAKQIGVSHDTVSRIWTGKHGIHRIHRKLQEYL